MFSETVLREVWVDWNDGFVERSWDGGDAGPSAVSGSDGVLVVRA